MCLGRASLEVLTSWMGNIYPEEMLLFGTAPSLLVKYKEAFYYVCTMHTSNNEAGM